jgi:hypothetical protein
VRDIVFALDDVPFWHDACLSVDVDDEVPRIEASGQRIGYYMVRGENRRELLGRFRTIEDRIRIEVDRKD